MKRKAKKTRNDERPARRKHSPAELANDPSLRFCGYTPGEALWSDERAGMFRFGGYDPKTGRIKMLTVGAMSFDGTADPLLVRRGVPAVSE